MRFTWDESKRQRTLQRRGLDFAQVAQVFAGPTFPLKVIVKIMANNAGLPWAC